MNIRSTGNLAILFLCSVGNGCTSGDLDFCSLLSLSEVRELDPDIVSGHMGVAGKSPETHYCFYRNSNNENVFQLSMGNPTKNPPYKVLQTYLPYMEGQNKVERIEGVGNAAAALFSDDYETDKFRILIANSDKWSITVRAQGIADEYSYKFVVLIDLADRALSRF